MNTIYVPTFPAFRGDVETMFSLLKEEVLKKYPGKFGIGLEIGGKPEHFTNQESLEKIVKNIKEVAGGAKTIVHGFSGLAIYTEGIADMSKDVGKNLLATYVDLAKKLKSNYVHVHGAIGYHGIKTPEDKPEVLNKVRKNLLWGLENSEGISIGIENLPTPSAYDFDSNPETVWSDYVEGIEDCMKIVKDTPLKITFDTAHYGINEKENPDLIKPLKEIGKYLGHIHVGDCKGIWIQNKSRAYDGVIPGDGRIGKDSFEKFFKYIAKENPNISICLEVQNKDFKNPEETRESIKRVCNWLE
ncbi:hypothetical protein A3K82_00430 [Candidatus Pacearchaeota archaeon RBG_19FT_COMBO_34_9]|nr:MAG: hypothetical protein A3K82_00430 [Candidatus Pacearchaeota archaeon RBG_19FT_COMBO_34_9]OGJ16232.1 MAG: hypothetical protein A3K74_03335 [Candidatus Pacearchaeota archaeon RBG_13_33_26]